MPIFSEEFNGTEKFKTIRLGSVDKESRPDNLKAFFKKYHSDFFHASMAKSHFRDEVNGDWNPLVNTSTPNYIGQWQAFLKRAGFLPFHKEDGIFGYVTLAASRLFQEYVRSVEGIAEIGVPDGVVGSKTRLHAHRWDSEGKKCSWWNGENAAPSQEYSMWINLFKKAKAHYLANPHPVIEAVSKNTNTGDSIKIKDWQWDADKVHFIGIRRNQDIPNNAKSRGNDDLFILLINGMVFKFWGSTDPNPGKSRSAEAYLVEGQHKYRMSWHKLSSLAKVYKALKPYHVGLNDNGGVLVFRDRDATDNLSDADIKAGLRGPNNSINIHWTGIGKTNYSQGCQVIAGSSYINPAGKLVDCSAFASSLYNDLSSSKTRGAYNVLSDIVLAYSPVDENTVYYTLGRDDVLDLHPDLGAAWAQMMVKNMQV